jgi:outer membrane lipoprotein carrier protein
MRSCTSARFLARAVRLLVARSRFWLAVLLCSTAPAVHAGLGTDNLNAFFDGLEGLRGSFEQALLDADGATVQVSEGTLVLHRPGKFRWDYRAPYEQVIVADGRNLWFYDTELEQVTVKPLGDAIGGTPAMLLSGARPLNEEFSVSELGSRGGLAWVELTPKLQQSNFERVRLGFEGRSLDTMEVEDAFGQVTRIRFMDLQRNPPIDPRVFIFVPPPGVDVVGEVS